MKQIQITKLISENSDLKLIKLSKNDVLLVDSKNSTNELVIGAKISSSRFSVGLSFWITPIDCYKSTGPVVFQSYEILKEGELEELMFNKDVVNEDDIYEKFKSALTSYLPVISEIRNRDGLLEFLNDNPQWLNSSFSKAHYSLILASSEKYEEAQGLLSSVLGKLNLHNPITEEARKLLDMLSAKDLTAIKEYLMDIKSVNSEKLNSLIKQTI